MKLDAVLKLKELKDFFDENQITVKKDRMGITLITKNNFTVSIHRQTHVFPGQTPLIYLDCLLRAYDLPEFRRNWHENENLSDYLVKAVIPYIADLAGPFTIQEKDAGDLIIKKLEECGIKADENKISDLKFTLFDVRGEEVESIVNNRPLITFRVKGKGYAINYHKSFIELIIFKNQEENAVLAAYPWHSFCSVFLAGKDYVDAAVEGIVNFINGRHESHKQQFAVSSLKFEIK